MHLKAGYRYTGVIAVLIQIFTILSVGICMNFNWFGPNPISDLGVSAIFCNYSNGLMFGAIMLAVFAYHLQKRYAPSKSFLVIFGIGIACEFLTGLIPDQAIAIDPFSSLSFIHLPAGATLLFTIPAAMWMFGHTKNMSNDIKKNSVMLSKIYMLLLVPELFLISHHVLYAASEAVSLAVFDVWVVYISSQNPANQSVPFDDESHESAVATI